MRNISDMSSVSEYGRHKIIIDFIISHPGCIAEDIIRGQNVIGREKVFKILKELKKDGAIIEKRTTDKSRNKKLFVKVDNHVVMIPRDIDEFEQLFFELIKKILERSSNAIKWLKTSLDVKFEEYRIQLRKKQNERLTLDEMKSIMQDVEVHTDFEELSIYVSSIVKVIDVFNEFVRLYTIQSVVKWPIEINDKESLSKLLSLVFNKISNMQIDMIGMISPTLKALFYDTDSLPLIRGEDPIDLDEINHYFKHFGLEEEAALITSHLTKISKNMKPSLRLPLQECNIISPSEVSAETMEEFLNPQEYYLEQFRKSLEAIPGEFEGVSAEQIRRMLFDKG